MNVTLAPRFSVREEGVKKKGLEWSEDEEAKERKRMRDGHGPWGEVTRALKYRIASKRDACMVDLEERELWRLVTVPSL